jgi:hypothetical protein
MPKFRKKPVVIEAVQYKGGINGFWDISNFVGKALIPYTLDENEALGIETLEGVMKFHPGDWIIKGVEGEFYPCRSDIFEKTYEEVIECDNCFEENGLHLMSCPRGYGREPQ